MALSLVTVLVTVTSVVTNPSATDTVNVTGEAYIVVVNIPAAWVKVVVLVTYKMDGLAVNVLKVRVNVVVHFFLS